MTPDEIQKNSAEHADFRVSILEMQRALYGDPKNGDLGMVAENHMMFEFFSGAMWFARSAKWIVGIIAFVASVIVGVWHFFIKTTIK